MDLLDAGTCRMACMYIFMYKNEELWCSALQFGRSADFSQISWISWFVENPRRVPSFLQTAVNKANSAELASSRLRDTQVTVRDPAVERWVFMLTGQDAIAHIRRESLDIYNRLHSIAEDVVFVNLVQSIYTDLPLLREYYATVFWVDFNWYKILSANLRCGAWYTDPANVSLASHQKFSSQADHLRSG